MLWIILIILIYLGALGGLYVVVGKKSLALDRVFEHNLSSVEQEKVTKLGVLTEIAESLKGMVSTETLAELDARREQTEETIRAEQGRITITEAELEAIDTRLRELEELKRELEVSNMDAVKELEMLRSQERDISSQNEAIRNQINASFEQVDLLLGQLNDSAEAVEQLTAAKNELINAEEKCGFYEEQISVVNRQYMALKKAYDALDIEYAQLYEKQQLAAE